jgi:ribose-phosphate pyrophosphokinase
MAAVGLIMQQSTPVQNSGESAVIHTTPCIFQAQANPWGSGHFLTILPHKLNFHGCPASNSKACLPDNMGMVPTALAANTTKRLEQQMSDDDVKIFALNAGRQFGDLVCQHLKLSLSPHEEREFEDQEHKIRPLASVRGKDVYVVCSLYADGVQSENDKLVKLLFFIAGLKDASAASVTAMVPYLAYSRKDRKSQPRDPVSSQYVARLFEAVGVDRVVTLDVHNLAAFQNAFRCRTDHLEANRLFITAMLPLIQNQEVLVMAPDAGGIKRAEHFRQGLSAALKQPVAAGFAEKYRAGGTVSGEALIGDIDGRVVIIVDDLISTGTTIARVASSCRQKGAKKIYALASHGVLVEAANTVLASDAIDLTIITNSLPPWRIHDPQAQAKLLTLNCAPLFADAIERLHSGRSLQEILE